MILEYVNYVLWSPPPGLISGGILYICIDIWKFGWRYILPAMHETIELV